MKKKLGDVFEIGSGGTPSKTHPEYYGGDIPWVKTGDLKSEYLYEVEDFITEEGLNNSSAKMYESDTVLIAMYGATIGATSILNFPACTNQACAAFKKSEEILPEYLYFFLRSKKEKFVNDGVGGTQPNISAGYLKKVQIEVRSLDEQSEIINVLDKVNRIIDERTKELAALDDLIKARFVEMFGDLMFNQYNWPLVKIADVSAFLKSGLSRKLSDVDIGLPVIRSGNIQNGQFIYGDVKYWYKEDPKGAKTEEYVLEDGDILINFINSVSQIGKTAVYRDVGRKCIYTTNIFRMKLNDNCNECYYNWFAMSDYYYRQLQNIIQPAVNQASFTTVNFLKLNIPLPPIELQNQFADFVNQVNKSKLVIKNLLQIYKHQIQM